MSDEKNADLQRSAQEADLREASALPRRNLSGLVALVLFVVVVALGLLLVRGCGAQDRPAESGGRSIETVEGLDPMPGVIALWVDEDAKVEKVANSAGVEARSFLDMGKGRYVVQVPEGAEETSAERLSGVPGVVDAGLVYQDAGASRDETGAP